MREVAGIDLEIEKLRQTICEIDDSLDKRIHDLAVKLNRLTKMYNQLATKLNVKGVTNDNSSANQSIKA